jgi:predicted nucleotidyltransferase
MPIDPKLLAIEQPTADDYKRERMLRGTQDEVAKQLGVRRDTVGKRETSRTVTREAWLALCALPLKKSPPSAQPHRQAHRSLLP